MKLRRISSLALAGGLLLSAGAHAGFLATPAAADADFNPVMTATRSTDAARAAAALHVRITQPDAQHQVGQVRIAVPRTYTFNTDAPGDGAQIGTAHLEAYINPRPSTLTIDATVHDGNDDCDAGSQCVVVKANIPGIGTVELPLEIEQTETEYVIAGDITSLWNDDYVRGIDARLKELQVDVNARVGSHVVFGNPATAGPHPFTYSFTSAKVDALGHGGGLVPDCGPVCDVALEAKEYAPSRSNLRAPASAGISASDTAQTFSWSPVTDANGDAVTYTLEVSGGPSAFTLAGLTGTTHGAGPLAPGNYTWKVSAVDTQGDVTTSLTWTLTVVDATTALKFVSAVTNDVLLVTPGAGFVYRIGGAKTTAAEYGAVADVSDVRGVITYTGPRFNLVGAYDTTTSSAALTFIQSGATNVRPFADPAL